MLFIHIARRHVFRSRTTSNLLSTGICISMCVPGHRPVTRSYLQLVLGTHVTRVGYISTSLGVWAFGHYWIAEGYIMVQKGFPRYQVHLEV